MARGVDIAYGCHYITAALTAYLWLRHEAAVNVLRIVIPIVIQIGLEHREKTNRNRRIGPQAIPANGTTISNNQNVLLEPFPSLGFLDLGQDRLAGRRRLGWNGSMHPLPGADVYDYQSA
jgi:hypothetical protein